MGSPRVGRHRLGVLVRWVCWSYLVGLAGVWLLLWAAADRWWPATLIMFGPRWLGALPLLVLLPAAALVRRRSLGPLLGATVIQLGPVMGLCIPWRTFWAQESPGPRIRVLTCNIHRHEVNPEALARLLADTRPDVVAFQEWSARDQAVVFPEPGWYFHRDGGVYLASRYPIVKVEVLKDPALAGPGDVVRYDLEIGGALVHFYNLHLASPRQELLAALEEGLRGAPKIQANSELRRKQAEVISRRVAQDDGLVLLAGDFNTPCDSRVYRDVWSRFSNAFSTAGWGWGYTFFTRRCGVRIDHILAGPGWVCRKCYVGPNVGSPHRPVIADMEWSDPLQEG